ncbi:MAG: sulfatase-like hydrolase/transferase, partial [Pirellulales bacterium]
GYTDLACYGSGYYETPHLDRMASEGMRFTNAYTCGANCQPTRAALMSGPYGPRTGVYTVGKIDRFNWQSRPLGGVGGYAREGNDQSKHITDNAPLRGGKGMYYEGGIRVPFIACWPGQIEAQTVCAEPIISVDLYPTLLDVTTSQPPAGQPLDGTSCLPLLTDTAQAPTARPPLYWHFPGFLGERSTSVGAIRDGNWKLMEFFEDGRLELYDLTHDVGEKKNLAADDPARAAALQARLAAWRHSIHAPMPTPNTKP